MANSSAKKLRAANLRRLKLLAAAIAAANLVFFVLHVALRRGAVPRITTALWLAFAVIYAAAYAFLYVAARPTYDAHANLLSAGHDLAAPGLLEYTHDLIYLAVVAQLLSPISRLSILIIPGFAAHLLVSNRSALFPTAPDRNDPAARDQAQQPSPFMSRKERRKAERDAQKNR